MSAHTHTHLSLGHHDAHTISSIITISLTQTLGLLSIGIMKEKAQGLVMTTDKLHKKSMEPLHQLPSPHTPRLFLHIGSGVAYQATN